MTKDLKEECGSFLENLSDFRKMSDGFIAFSDQVTVLSLNFKDPSAGSVAGVC